jgi:hypothetical protein
MQVRIYIPTKTSTQSGHAGHFWLMEFIEQPNSKFKESLMGRTSSNDTSSEVKIKFPTLEKALEFAKKKNYDFEVIHPKKQKLIKKPYASNFG